MLRPLPLRRVCLRRSLGDAMRLSIGARAPRTPVAQSGPPQRAWMCALVNVRYCARLSVCARALTIVGTARALSDADFNRGDAPSEATFTTHLPTHASHPPTTAWHEILRLLALSLCHPHRRQPEQPWYG